jgi:hypothetical protein
VTTFDVSSVSRVTLDVADWPVRRAAADTLSALMVALGRGFHSSSFPLNLSRFFVTEPTQRILQKVLTLSRKLD